MLSIQETTSTGITAPFVDSNLATPAQQEESECAGQILAYNPHHILGGSPHPGVIVETPGLANVEPPPITYRPHLPNAEIWTRIATLTTINR